MKRFYLFITCLVLLSNTAYAVIENKEVTGLDWLQMSIGERFDYIMVSIYVLNKNGVELSGTPNDYYNAIENKIKTDTKLYSKNVTNILADFVYENEPASRESLEKIKS